MNVVTVQLVRTKLHGFCEWRPRLERFDICISVRDPLAVQIETLVHEWAHVRADESCFDRRMDHSNEWGENYAECYRGHFRRVLKS